MSKLSPSWLLKCPNNGACPSDIKKSVFHDKSQLCTEQSSDIKYRWGRRCYEGGTQSRSVGGAEEDVLTVWPSGRTAAWDFWQLRRCRTFPSHLSHKVCRRFPVTKSYLQVIISLQDGMMMQKKRQKNHWLIIIIRNPWQSHKE